MKTVSQASPDVSRLAAAFCRDNSGNTVKSTTEIAR